MFNQVQICNLALQSQGANPITSINDNSKEAILCLAYWDIVRDIVLGSHNWSFALKWQTLAQATVDILDDRYAYAYALPADFLRLSQTGANGALVTNYVRRGKYIMSSETPFSVEYVYRVEDESSFPIYFVNALAAQLRAELSVPLTMDGAKLIDWFRVAEAVLETSMTADAQQSNPMNIDDYGDTDVHDTFITSRS